MVELGYGIAYRVLDAQYFGVPQRRRRVFVVGCLGDWQRAAEVLFEPGCVSGDSKKGGKARQAVAALTANGVGTCGADGNQGQTGHLIAHALRGEGFDASEDGTGRGTPLVAAYQCHGTNIGPMGTLRKGDGNVQSGVPFIAGTLGANHENIRAEQAWTGQLIPSTGRLSHCLNAEGFDASEDGTGRGTPLVAATLTSGSSSPTSHGKKNGTDRETLIPVAGTTTGVRRLTPRECERLQGFPDDWTMIPYRGKPAADGPRYKAIGNSMAVPVMRWIGKRIEEQHR